MNPAEHLLHLAGLDGLPGAFDLQAYGYDSELEVDTPRVQEHEHLPQLGPPFVAFVHERFTELDRKITRALERWSYEPRTDVFIASMQTSGAGGIDIATNDKATLYEPPPGFTFALHRFVIFDTAHTLGTPYTGAGSWWELRINNEMVDGNPMVSGQGQLPAIATWGTRDAIRVRDGEVLSLFMSGGPTNTRLVVKGQGTLDRTAEG